MADAEPRVRSGQIVALRLFDLKRAEQFSASRAQGASAHSRSAGTSAKALCFGGPPLALDLPGAALLDKQYLLASRRYARLAHRLHRLVAEVSELTERVDNALQVTEDVALARIHVAAMELPACPT